MKNKHRILIQIILVLALVSIGIFGCQRLKGLRKDLGQRDTTPSDPMARVMAVKAEDIRVPIEGYGTVTPEKQIKLVPQVSGKIVHVSPQLVDGGKFNKGDVLAVVDPADYEIAVTLAKARVQDSESRLLLQEQEASVARSDWKELYPQKPIPSLVAKEPQLKAAQANLEAVKAELERAKLNLSRTRLVVPFDGRVTEKNVDIGQYVTPGQTLAVLYSTQAAEIVIPLESKHLFWIDVPGFTTSNTKGSDVAVTAEIGGQETTWSGKISRAEGRMDERTRMINVVVMVEDPYDQYPPLAMGLFVKTIIKGKSVDNGIIIPRAAMHQDDIVWVVDDGKLSFRPVEVALRMYDGIVIKKGLSDGEKVVVSAIKDVTNGMKVREVLINGGGNAS